MGIGDGMVQMRYFGQKTARFTRPLIIRVGVESEGATLYHDVRQEIRVAGEITYRALMRSFIIEATEGDTTITIEIPEEVYEAMSRLKGR